MAAPGQSADHPGDRPGTSRRPVRRSGSIVATGAYLPERILTNAELEKMVETSDEWIRSRTGIRERRIAAEDETASGHGHHRRPAGAGAGRNRPAGDRPDHHGDLYAPTLFFPRQPAASRGRLGRTRAAAFDLQAACAGFLFALVTADQFIASGVYKTILIVGTEKLSSIVNWKDRNTCVLFGDGAGRGDPAASRGRAGTDRERPGLRRNSRTRFYHCRPRPARSPASR